MAATGFAFLVTLNLLRVHLEVTVAAFLGVLQVLAVVAMVSIAWLTFACTG